MSHHIYHTRGIILGSISTKESNRFYKILTDDLGLVGASAQAVRDGKSKLRYALQDFSCVTVDLVRGKEMWRIISAAEESFFSKTKEDPVRFKLFARVCSLAQRLIHGEGREDTLLLDIRAALRFLEKGEIPQELEMAFESLSAFRTLVFLGYLDPRGREEFVEPGVWSIEILEEFEKVRISIIPLINDALHASQL